MVSPGIDGVPIAEVTGRQCFPGRRSEPDQALADADGRSIRIPRTKKHLLTAGLEQCGQFGELLGPRTVQDILAGFVDGVVSEPAAAEEPDLPVLQLLPVPFGEAVASFNQCPM